jgi:hypothetical protein
MIIKEPPRLASVEAETDVENYVGKRAPHARYNARLSRC